MQRNDESPTVRNALFATEHSSVPNTDGGRPTGRGRPAAEIGAPGVIRQVPPLVVPDVDIEVYHASPGISKTGLDAIDRSAGHYFAWHMDANRPPARQKSGQLEGSLAHCAVLEPHAFGKRYIVMPDGAPRRPTEAQWNAKKPSEESVASMSWWREFNARHGDKLVITTAQYDTAMRQAESIRAISDVAEALDKGRPELSAWWTDPVTGELCRCRPDCVADYGRKRVVLLDVKTCNDASRDEFRRMCARKRYHVQDAFYSDGYAAAAGVEVLGFLFVAVEDEWPFAANALMLGERSRRQGRVDYRRNLGVYAECRRTGQWPSYGPDVQIIDLPEYAMTVTSESEIE